MPRVRSRKPLALQQLVDGHPDLSPFMGFIDIVADATCNITPVKTVRPE